MASNTPDTGIIEEYVGNEIEARQQDTLDAAARVTGTSNVEAEQARVDTEKQFEDRNPLAVAGESLMRTGADINASGAILRELDHRSIFMNDPNWNPRKNPEQMKELEGLMEGIPLEFTDGILGAGSLEAAQIQREYANQELESMQFIADAGLGRGMLPMFMGSMLDIDAVVAGGAFTKLAKARNIAKMGRAGQRATNVIAGVEAGATAALVTETVNAQLRPTIDAGDVWGATIVSAGLVGTIGAAMPTKVLNSAMDSTNLSKAVRAGLAAERTKKTGTPLPKGVRYNNPGNIEYNTANDWQGQKGVGPDGRFAEFESPEDGIRAMHVLLGNYGNRGINTIREIISTYAPRSENNSDAYIKAVSKNTGIDPDELVDLNDFDTSYRLVQAIMRHENGADFYTPEIIQEGIMRSMQPDKEPTYTRKMNLDNSVGAAALERMDISVSPTTAAWTDRVDQFWDENPEAMYEVNQADTWGQSPVQQLGKRIHDGLQKTPFIADYDRMRNLNSNVGKWLGYQLLESPIGIARNRRSANNLSHHMYETVAEEVSPSVAPLYKQWAKDQGISFTSPEFHMSGQEEFARQIMAHMENRYWGQEDPNVHASIKEISDNYDRANKKMLDYSQGLDGAPAVNGMEDVQFKSGWFRRKWRGDKITDIARKIGEDKLIKALTTGISKASDIDADWAFILSKAIVRRAQSKDVGSSFGEFGSVSNDGKAFAAQALKDHAPNMSDDEAVAAVEAMFGTNPDRGKLDFARKRIEIDLRTPIEGTNMQLLDMIDNDMIANQERYYRAAANYSALARKGIQKTDIPGIKTAVLEEARASGKDVEGAGKFLDDVFSYFGEGAYAGGSGPIAGRLNKLAVMSYLGNVGITQLAEVGATMGVAGLKAYAKYAGQTIPAMLKGKDPEVLKSLQSIGVYTGDHRLVVRAISMDEVDLDSANKLLRGLDQASDKGMRALGYISGFYKVTEAMNAAAALTMQDLIVRGVRDGKHASRLKYDLGVDDAFASNIKRYIDNGTIEFDADGLVKDMHYEDWDPVDAEDAALSIKLGVRQVVQKPQRGEEFSWGYRQVGSLLLGLKRFVVNAGQKQMLRNMRHADAEALMTLLYGTGTAATAFAARQALNGNIDEMSAQDLAVGAIQWGNMTAPALMVIDPLSYMLGADRIPGSPFPLNEWRYEQKGLVAMPAGMSALAQLGGLPRIPSDFIDNGDLGAESVNAIKAIPVLGRSYPMLMMLNSLSE